MKIKGPLFSILWIMGGALILCSGAIINGYPFVYPDTGTYIAACFQKFIPEDRAIAYSFFIKHTSLAESLWLVILAQSTLLSFSMYLILKKTFKLKKAGLIHIGIVIFLCLSTGISFMSSELIPDLFTPIAILCGIFILFTETENKYLLVLVHVIFAFAIACHFSNFLTYIPIALFSLICFFIKRKKDNSFFFRRTVHLSCTLLLSFLINPVIGKIYTGKTIFLPEARSAFFVNRLYDAGILADYLNRTCGKRPTIFCEVKDWKNFDLLWSELSPLVKYGGKTGVKKDCDDIIENVLSEKKYIFWLIKDSFFNTFKQLLRFETETGEKLGKNSTPYGPIEWHFTNEKESFLRSKQATGKISYELINCIQKINVIVCLAASLFLIFVSLRRTGKKEKKIFLFLVTAIFFNAATTASFAVVDQRFTGRVIWLIPFFTIAFLINHLTQIRTVEK